MPLITPKEREIDEPPDQDWMWRVHHAQCPDPAGRVIYKFEQVAAIGRDELDHDVVDRHVVWFDNDRRHDDELDGHDVLSAAAHEGPVRAQRV